MKTSRQLSRGGILALICLPIFIGALDLTVVSAVLPQVIFDLEIPLQTGLDEAAWIVTGYLLSYSVAMTFMGRLSDLYGRRRVFLLALVIFGLGSYLVAVADGWPTRIAQRVYTMVTSDRTEYSQVALMMLIAARMLQAFGGGAMVPVGMALVGDLYPAGMRARPLGLIAAVDTAGWVVGHLYGGIIVQVFDWRLIFWLNLPVCVLALILIRYALHEHPESRLPGRMDWLGATLIALSLTALNVGLGSPDPGASYAESSEEPLVLLPLIGISLVFFLLFLWRQARARQPLIPLDLFRRKNFSPAIIANFLIGYSIFVAIANVPLFINTLIAPSLEQGAWDSGWMLSALTVPMAIAAIPGGWLTSRYGYRMPATLGVLGAVIGFGLMSRWQASIEYAQMAPHLILTGVGFGFTLAPTAAAAVDAATASDRGAASALVIILRLIGMTIGISSMTTYGLERNRVLLTEMLEIGVASNEMIQVVMQVAERIIGETFIIAGLVCALAIVPILWMKLHPRFPLERKEVS